ncbi:MAG: TetR family transcriptional regulator, partial [Paracoccaceae bacterium]
MAGLAALAEAGPVALKAEPMARRLGTTKGSFYWHFAD